MDKEITEKYIIDNSIFRVGKVIEVVGQKVRVGVDTDKNTSSILYNGEILQNISVGGYVKIKKGFEVMIGKIEGEYIKENKDVKDFKYQSNKEKILRVLEIKIIGFFEGFDFKRGIKELPLIDNKCFLLKKEEFDEIHDFVDKENNDKPLRIGSLEFDDGIRIDLGINKLFASHIGIFGNTGSGKSYTLAKIYRELFINFQEKNDFKENAEFFLIDLNGEYIGEQDKDGVYKNTNVITDGTYKNIYNLSTNIGEDFKKIEIKSETLNDSIFWSILLEATEKTQAPFINDTLNNNFYLNNIFSSSDLELAIKQEILDIIWKGIKRSDKNLSTKIFTEFFSKLYKCVENDISKDHIRRIKDLITSELNFNGTNESYFCNSIDNNLEKYFESSIETLIILPIKELLEGVTFIISEIKNIRLKIILNYYSSIMNGFGNREHISGLIKRILDGRVDLLDRLITVGDRSLHGKNFTVVSLKDVHISMRKIIPLLLVKELYEEKKKENNKDKSLHLIIDEAHNILSEHSQRENEEWKDYRLETFEEIIKEGRKFGTFLTLSSQRPSDISSTIISQLHNYFIHRLINENDLRAVEKTISYLDKVSADSIPNLSTGTCVLAGLMAQIPVVIKVGEIKNPENQPQSHNIDLLEKWG